MYISKEKVKKLSVNFRSAIDQAKELGEFDHYNDFSFFPSRCCGNVSYLLAYYLRLHGIETIWVSYRRADWTHAWLVVKDDRVSIPAPHVISFPDNIRKVFVQYGNPYYKTNTEFSFYREQDLRNGLIIDITGDQFDDYGLPVYVGFKDHFHNTFEFVHAVDFITLSDERLSEIYKAIEVYL